MARKKRATRAMKIKDPDTSRDSKYAKKRANMKKGIFTDNSPFNPDNHHQTQARREASLWEELRVQQIKLERVLKSNVVDLMIETNRGVTDEQLPPARFEASDTEEENIHDNRRELFPTEVQAFSAGDISQQ